MSLIDVESLLQEISPESPCGDDLTYDPDYTSMEGILSAGLSEGMVGDGGEESGPNWRDLRTRCVALFGRTKDLRVCMNLTVALLMEDSISGFRDGLALLRGLIDRYWDSVYPQLDPDDNNDPLERVNIIAALSAAPGAFMDPMMFRKRVHMAPLSKSDRLGRFSLRDLELARGGGDLPAGAPDVALIDASFEDTATEELQGMAEAIDEAVDHLVAIDGLLMTHVGAGQAPNLDALRTESLGSIRNMMADYLSRRGLGDGPVGDSATVDAGGSSAPSGAINSPQDVLAALGTICQYYEKHEPSSPVPLLMRRAQGLVSKSFMDIVRDLAPEVVSQMEQLGGIDSSL